MARPRIELTDKDWVQIEKMCAIFCTGEEIAAILGISYDTLERRVKERFDMSCAEYIKEKSAIGKMSLRRMQYKAAEKGNNAMLIWLGKQYLGQTDKQDLSDDTIQKIQLAYSLNQGESMAYGKGTKKGDKKGGKKGGKKGK